MTSMSILAKNADLHIYIYAIIVENNLGMI